MSWLFKEEDPKPTPVADDKRLVPRTGLVIDKIGDQTHDVLRSQPVASAPGADAYNSLRTKTDFASTDVGAALARYSEPLITVLPDEKMRARTAAKLAEKEGISADKILATFDGLKVALQAEVAKFNSAGSQEEANIAAKEAQIRDLSAQMAALQTQVTQLGGEIGDARNHINRVKTEFNSAVNRRVLELDAEKTHYADLLR